jgi:hypothetical protein
MEAVSLAVAEWLLSFVVLDSCEANSSGKTQIAMGESQ